MIKQKRTPATGRGSCRCVDRRKLASGLLSGGRRIDGPLVGAEVAEQHLTGLQIFLGEATARRWASVDRASGNSGAAYDRSAAHNRSTGNGPCIRNAHAAAAVDVGIGVLVSVVVVVIIVIIVVVIVVVARGLRRSTERRAFQLADQIRIDRLDA